MPGKNCSDLLSVKIFYGNRFGRFRKFVNTTVNGNLKLLAVDVKVDYKYYAAGIEWIANRNK